MKILEAIITPACYVIGILLAFITDTDEEADQFLHDHPITINVLAYTLTAGWFVLCMKLAGVL